MFLVFCLVYCLILSFLRVVMDLVRVLFVSRVVIEVVKMFFMVGDDGFDYGGFKKRSLGVI